MLMAPPPRAKTDNARDPLVKPISQLVELITKVLGPTTVLAALAYYLGWVRTDRILRQLGIDSSLMSLSIEDYIMRSADVTLNPLRWLLTAVLGGVIVHGGICWLAARSKPFTRWLRPAVIGAGIVVATLSEVARHRVPDLWPPAYALIWTAGLALAAYGWTFAPGPRRINPAADALLAWVSGALIVLGLFWALEMNATVHGNAAGASLLTDRAASKPCVVVYSKDALEIGDPNVQTTQVGDEKSAFRFRYSGLRLLLRSGEKLFLAPSTWDDARPVSLMLTDSDTIRLDLYPTGGSKACPEPTSSPGRTRPEARQFR